MSKPYCSLVPENPQIASWRVGLTVPGGLRFLEFRRGRDPTTTAAALLREFLELLGHSDVSTTMIDTHLLNRPGLEVRSPADG
jgi:integrase